MQRIYPITLISMTSLKMGHYSGSLPRLKWAGSGAYNLSFHSPNS